MASLKKRGKKYYASYYVNGKEQRRALNTENYQVAKQRLRNLDVAQAKGVLDDTLPTRTKVADMVTQYAAFIKSTKAKNGVKIDFWYLRNMFGPVCELLHPHDLDRWEKKKRTLVAAKYLEDIRTPDIATFISQKVIEDGIAPKTANRYREIFMRLFTWAIKQRGVRMPGNSNPAKDVERYRERAPEITFLEMNEIGRQLIVLEDDAQLQTIVALFIYAGLRREEALWLTSKDIDLAAGKYGMIRVRAKTVLGESWQPKTKKNRAVPISSTLRRYLEDYRVKRVAGGWYFPSRQAKRWDPDNFSDHLRKTNLRHNMKWSCQDYRHTFGSQLAMKGESLYKISTLMGNSPEVCRKHYAALLPESLVDCVEFDRITETETEPVSEIVPGHPMLRLIVNEKK